MAMHIDPVTKHRTTLCQAVTGYGHSSQIPRVQRCQQTAAHSVDGVGLCGTHFNAGYRKQLTVVTTMRQLNDGDL